LAALQTPPHKTASCETPPHHHTTPHHTTLMTSRPLSLYVCCVPQFVAPYTFPSFHSRLLEPYNYYAFGQRYVSTLIDFSNSFLGHADLWKKVSETRHNNKRGCLL